MKDNILKIFCYSFRAIIDKFKMLDIIYFFSHQSLPIKQYYFPSTLYQK